MDRERIESGPLFEPITIRGLTLKNRIVMASMHTNFANDDGSVSARQIAYLEKRARGGAGLVMVEFAYVDSKGSAKFDAGQLGVESDERGAGLARLAAAIHSGGARGGMQLCHSGAFHFATRHAAVGPSPVPWSPTSAIPRELTIGEIQEIVASFGDAAGRVQRAGFDLLEVHAAHGYLINNFVSAYSNRRRDRYGGPLENRMRIALEVAAAIRSAVGPDFPISFRINGEDYAEDGNSVRDQVRVARALEQAGVDLIHVSGGMWQGREYRTAPMYMPRGPYRQASAAIKAAVKVPVMLSGSMGNPEDAAEALVRRDADLISCARQFLADPDWPTKVAEGTPERISPCIRCNECLARLTQGRPIACTVNPLGGRELEPDLGVQSAKTKKTVLVIGGGPAGLQAAIVASRRGHRVTLVEQTSGLGGQLISAALPEIKQDLQRWLAHLRVEVSRLGVAVELNTRIDTRDIGELEVDYVFLATGSVPELQKFQSVSGCEVSDVEAAYRSERGQRATLVAASSAIGLELAWWLAQGDSDVTITWPEPEIRDDFTLAREALTSMLKRAGCRLLLGARIAAVDMAQVNISQDGRLVTVPVQRVVVEAPRRSNALLADALTARGLPYSVVGDAAEPGRLIGATHAATEAALAI